MDNVRVLIETRLQNWANLHGVAVAYENQDFTPPNAVHIESYLLKSNTTAIDLKGTVRVQKGIFQMTVVDPNRGGPGASQALVDQLDALFPVNLLLTDGVVRLLITQPLNSQPSQTEPNTYRVPTRFVWRADMV